mmetsp:Transcript_620/g.1268  ORF Transcript_620/g.1268 Transcript_620/m.1268 type:complete len:80 (+) Transcript_620:1622-1861(+)
MRWGFIAVAVYPQEILGRRGADHDRSQNGTLPMNMVVGLRNRRPWYQEQQHALPLEKVRALRSIALEQALMISEVRCAQ